MAKNTVELGLNLKTRLAQQYKRVADRVRGYNSQIQQSMRTTGAAADKSFGRIRGIAASMGSSIKSFAATFGPAAAAVAALTFAVRGLGKAVAFVRQSTEGFEKSMSKIKAIVQPSTKGLEDLTKQAKELGETTAFSASQAADAFTELGKIGFKTNQIIAASADVLNLAAIAETDMATSATVVGETMAGFGIEAEEATRVVDTMAAAFSSSALDMTKFSESAKFVGATAGALGVPLEDTTAALSALANAGVHGSMAGTAMRRIMLMLFDPTSKAGKMIGLAADDTRTFAERLEALQSKNLSPAQIKNTFGLLATTSATVLIKANEQVKELTKLYKEGKISAEEMARVMLDNVAGATKIMESAQEGLAIAIGETFGASKQKRIQFYTKLIGWLKDTVIANKEQFRQFGEQISNVLMALARLAQIIATQLIQHFDKIISALKIIAAVGAVKGIFAMVGAFRALGPVVAAAGGRLAAFKAVMVSLSSVGIMGFLVGLQIAMDKILSGMEELARTRDEFGEKGMMDESQMERVHALLADFETAQAEAGRQAAARAKQSQDHFDIMHGKVVQISDAEIEANRIMKDREKQLKKITGYTVDELKNINLSSLGAAKHLSTLKKVNSAKKAALDADAEAARIAAEAAAAARAAMGGGAGGTDEAAANKLAEEQQKAIDAAQQLQDALHFQTLEGREREAAELQAWYTEKGAILLAGDEGLTELNKVFRAKNAAITKKWNDADIAERQASAAKVAEIEKQKMQHIQTALGGFASALQYVAEQNKQFAGLYKATAIAETTIATYMAAQQQFAAASKLPPPAGLILPPIVAAAAIAQGLVRVAQIKAQKFQHGGIAQGSRDSVPAMLTPGEMVLNGQQQRNLMAMASGTGSGGGAPVTNQIEINIQNGNAATVRGAVNAALADTYQERIQQFAEMENEVESLDAGVAL